MDWQKQLCTTRLLDQNFGMCVTPQDLILPFYNFHGTNYFRPWRLCTESDKDFGSKIDNTKDTFKVTLDVQHFLPNEINVKVTDNEVIIEGKHEERQDDHGFISRQFIRRYVLPIDCKTDTVTSTLSSDGVLIIMAKKAIPKDTKDKEKMVPIKMCGPCPKKEEKIKSTTQMTHNGTSDAKKATELSNKDSQMLIEDHCRLLKPELLKETFSGTEKLLSESRKETDELLKLISSDKPTTNMSTNIQPTINMPSGKLEEALGQCKTAIAELKEMVGEESVKGASDMSSLKSSMISETLESRETISSTSKTSMSMSSSMKAASEKTSELLMCAALKEAAK